mmetsp:Transcript_22899/g.33953  ORF Transcript_22899/g.33953 Transcript_22899/m.33953 type:complete len:111 (-) Transcript_22899:829-1161(-)
MIPVVGRDAEYYVFNLQLRACLSRWFITYKNKEHDGLETDGGIAIFSCKIWQKFMRMHSTDHYFLKIGPGSDFVYYNTLILLPHSCHNTSHDVPRKEWLLSAKHGMTTQA